MFKFILGIAVGTRLAPYVNPIVARVMSDLENFANRL